MPGALPVFRLAFAWQAFGAPALPGGGAAVGRAGDGDVVPGVAGQGVRGGVVEAVAPTGLGDGARGLHGAQESVAG